MGSSTFSCVGSSVWFTLHLSRRCWTRRIGRVGTEGGGTWNGLSGHLILGLLLLLLLLLFLTRSVIVGSVIVGSGVTDIDRRGLNIRNGQRN